MQTAALLPRVRIVLCRPSHAGNIGAVARAMKNMGFRRLSLVQPRRWDSSARSEATARSSGAEDLLEGAQVSEDLDSALSRSIFTAGVSARRRDIGPPLYQVRAGAAHLYDRLVELEQYVAGCSAMLEDARELIILFGNESSGLSNAELALCHGLIQIPSDPDFASLNLAAAVQLVCYEIRMSAFAGIPPQPGQATPQLMPLATHAEMRGLYAHLFDVMARSRFYDPAKPKRLPDKLRRLLQRAAPSSEEVNILRGILSAVAQFLPEQAERETDNGAP